MKIKVQAGILSIDEIPFAPVVSVDPGLGSLTTISPDPTERVVDAQDAGAVWARAGVVLADADLAEFLPRLALALQEADVIGNEPVTLEVHGAAQQAQTVVDVTASSPAAPAPAVEPESSAVAAATEPETTVADPVAAPVSKARST